MERVHQFKVSIQRKTREARDQPTFPGIKGEWLNEFYARKACHGKLMVIKAVAYALLNMKRGNLILIQNAHLKLSEIIRFINKHITGLVRILLFVFKISVWFCCTYCIIMLLIY